MKEHVNVLENWEDPSLYLDNIVRLGFGCSCIILLTNTWTDMGENITSSPEVITPASSFKVFFLLLCQNYYFHGQVWTFTLNFLFYWLRSRDLEHFCLHTATQWRWNLQCASHRSEKSRFKNIQHQCFLPENSVHVTADDSQDRVACEIVTMYKSSGFVYVDTVWNCFHDGFPPAGFHLNLKKYSDTRQHIAG